MKGYILFGNGNSVSNGSKIIEILLRNIPGRKAIHKALSHPERNPFP